MRNIKTHSKSIKKKLNKCSDVFIAFNEIQYQYGCELDLNDEIKEIKCNVRLIDFELGDNYTSDFYIIKNNGEVIIRECVFKERINKPLTISLLDASRNYWLSKGITDWGIVLNED